MALLGQVFHFSSLPLNRYSATCFNLFPESGLALPISPGLVPLTAPFTKPLPIAPRRKGPTAAAPPLNGPNPGRDDGARRRPFYLFFPPRASPAKKMPPRGQTLAGIDGKTDNGAIEPHAFKLLLASFCRGSSFPGLKRCSCVFNFSPHFRQTRSRRMTVSNARVAMTPVSAFRRTDTASPLFSFCQKSNSCGPGYLYLHRFKFYILCVLIVVQHGFCSLNLPSGAPSSLIASTLAA